MNVVKRDGRKVPFNQDRIRTAIIKAFKSVDGEVNQYALDTAGSISISISKLADHKEFNIEDIQDLVETKLMTTKRKDVAKSYIEYRLKRDRERDKNSRLFKDIAKKLQATDVQNQNANVDESSFGGRIGEATDAMMKKYALDFCMSDLARENHLNNMIYTHDLNHYAVGNHNCLSIPFDDLLAYGFNTRQTDVRPAQSVSTAFQLVAVIFQLQSLQQFGGVAATHLDWTMIPYVRKSFYKHYRDGMKYLCGEPDWNLGELINDTEGINDITDISIDCYDFYDNQTDDSSDDQVVYQYAMDMTTKEVYQAVEGMYHNLNTLQSRSGNQLPFTSINYGTCTLLEGRMVTKAILEVSIKGIGKLHKTPIFPCGIFQCMKGVNRKKGEPNYDLFQLALRSTAQRLYPNYVNVDWSVNEGYDKNDPRTYCSTMGKCKL